MSTKTPDNLVDQLVVRTFDPKDQSMVQQLYTDGLLAGQIAPNDTGLDIDNIQDEYLGTPQNHFWVAQVNNQVLGMIGVVCDQQHTAEIRRLRVHKDWQHTEIAETLIETALAHCQRHGYLKIVLDTRFDPNTALDLFERFRFQHTRTRSLQQKELLEFYLDLYSQDKSETES